MTKKRKTQLSLFSRKYHVRSGGFETVVTAQTRGEAKNLAFKFATEVGMYRYEGGFFAFATGVSIKELKT